MPEKMSEDTLERLSDRMSGDIQRMSHRMSEEMPERMSERCLVMKALASDKAVGLGAEGLCYWLKYTTRVMPTWLFWNVMVGITRSKVICFLYLYFFDCLRDFESHCFQGYRGHKHHAQCLVRGTRRWWQCGLRAELRLCESWAMKEPDTKEVWRWLSAWIKNSKALPFSVESRSSQNIMSKLCTDLTCLMMPFNKLPIQLRKSELKPPGDNRIQFSATGDEEFNDVDWTLRLEGQLETRALFCLLKMNLIQLHNCSLPWAWLMDVRIRSRRQVQHRNSLLHEPDMRESVVLYYYSSRVTSD